MQIPFTPGQVSLDNISFLYRNGIELYVLRIDKIHPLVSGNKWYKLHYYLEEANQQHKKGILTFGGAWSNHILATAAACHMQGLAAIGVIRGEEPREWSSTLLQAKELNMQLLFVSREQYRAKAMPAAFAADYYYVNEGGYGKPGARGAAAIIESYKDFTHYCCAVGTGTMMAGLINAAEGKQVTGISVLKSNIALEQQVLTLVENKNFTCQPTWKLLHNYHFGGYAKHEPRLLQFMNAFYRLTGIPSDFVYTGKLFFAVDDLVRKDYFPSGSKILVVHSGGIQGNTSLDKGVLIF